MAGDRNQPKESRGSIILETLIALGCQAAVVYLTYLDLMQNGIEQARLVTILTLIEIVLLILWGLYKAVRRAGRPR